MRRFFVWLFRIAGIVGLLTSGVLLFYILFVPSIAERQIVRLLREMGIADASVYVHCVGPRHLLISDLTLGEEAGLRIGAMNLDYETSLLGDLTVKSIDVIGATLDLRTEDGKLDLGPLANIKSTSEEQRYASDGLPFERVTIRSSSIAMHWNGRRFALPVEATITHKQEGECDVEATIWLLGAAVPFKGVIDFSAPNPAVTAPSANPVADRISFRLTTPMGEKTLTFAGWTSGEAVGTSIVAAIKPTSESANDEFIAFAVVSHRSGEGTRLMLGANASDQPVHLALGGYEIEASGLSCHAREL